MIESIKAARAKFSAEEVASVQSTADKQEIPYVSSSNSPTPSPAHKQINLDFSRTQDQSTIVSQVVAQKPQAQSFVKDAPIYGYRITSDKFSDLPAEIQKVLGGVDKTTYTAEYLAKNQGSVIALQMNGSKPDLYIIGKDTLTAKYQSVPVGDVAIKNPKLVKSLSGSEISSVLRSESSNIVALRKSTSIDMLKMSDLGYPKEKSVTIQSPWGGQTKPAGKDAYLVFDSSKNQYYMVNTDEHGLPISYTPK